jgi:hypothetical protein
VLHHGVRAPAHATMDDDCVDVPAPSTTIDITSPFCMPYIRPLILPVDKCQATPISITGDSIPESAHLTDVLPQAMKTANSLPNSPSVVPHDDLIHVESVITDIGEALDTKNIEHCIDALPPRTSALAPDNALIENVLSICNASSHSPNFRPFAPLDSFPMLLPPNTDTNPSGPTHPADVLAHKTKVAASWLKPLILVTKYATGRLTLLPPTTLLYHAEKSRPYKLKQQKV